MKIRFEDIKPNPYRDLKANPLLADKIEALIESVLETGFWDNVVVRKNAKGEYEQAYGHHRVAAAIKAGLTEANFIVKTLNNDMMLKMMARENAEVYGNDAKSTVESVAALIQAYGTGTLDHPEKLVPALNTDTKHIRYAPSYVPGKVTSPESGELPYTITTIAKWLGSTRKKNTEAQPNVIMALDFLELVELNIGGIKSLADLKLPDPIPVFSAMKIIKDKKREHGVIMERAKIKAAQTVQDGEAIKRKLAALQQEQKKAEAESERLLEEQTKAEAANAVKRAAEAKRKLEEKQKEEKERSVRITLAKAEQKTLDKERAKDTKATEGLAQKEKEKAEARWLSHSKTLRDRLDRFMSTNDPLYDELLTWTRDKRVTEPQRALLSKALADLVGRITQFNPNPARPIARKGERK